MDISKEKNAKVPFEEALDQTGFGLYSILMTGLTGLITISFICTAYGTSIIVPASACELETTSAQQGMVVAAPIVGGLVGSLLWGYLGDTRGRRSMLLVGLVSSATINALASISVNWVMLMVLQFLTVTLASGKYLLSMTILSESVPAAKRNVLLLFVSSIFVLGQGIMAVLAIPIIPQTFSYYLPALDIYWNSWRTLQVVYSIPSLVCACWLYFMQESPKFVLAKGDEEGALRILRKIHRANNGRKSEELQVKGLLQEESKSKGKSSTKDQIVPLFKAPYLKYTLIMSLLFILFQITAGFIVWLPTISNQFMQFIQRDEGSDFTLCEIIASSTDAPIDPDAVPCSINSTALLIVLGINGVQSLFNLFLSQVVDKVGRRNMSMVMTLLCGVGGILVNLVPNAIGSAAMFGIFSLGVVIMGLYTAMTVALFPTHLRTMAMALCMMGGRMASFGFIQIINYLLVQSCELGFYLFCSLFASSALVLTLLPDDRTLIKEKLQTEKEPEDEMEGRTSL